jgi:DNA-binding transcriptional LysR family regulator
MNSRHELLSRKPFDLYQLHLFRLVATAGSFTQAARSTGLTQSAISRQIQSLEEQLGVLLFTRTTRSVIATSAGQFLLRESGPVLGDVDVLIRRLKEEYGDAPPEVRVGVSRSVSLAYLPGFFSRKASSRSLHTRPVVSRVTHESSTAILNMLEVDQLDVGVLLPPPRFSTRLKITHRFQDAFTFIAHGDRLAAGKIDPAVPEQFLPWLPSQPYLALARSTETGRRLAKWLETQALPIAPSMELDNFDLIINLVALGLGFGLVPQRALAPYNRRKALVRLLLKKRFTRELVVLVRRQRKVPEHVQSFVDNILF